MAVTALSAVVSIVATVFGVVDDILEFRYFPLLDDVEDFTIFSDGSFEVA